MQTWHRNLRRTAEQLSGIGIGALVRFYTGNISKSDESIWILAWICQ